jgi:hypothetical protein
MGYGVCDAALVNQRALGQFDTGRFSLARLYLRFEVAGHVYLVESGVNGFRELSSHQSDVLVTKLRLSERTGLSSEEDEMGRRRTESAGLAPSSRGGIGGESSDGEDHDDQRCGYCGGGPGPVPTGITKDKPERGAGPVGKSGCHSD